MKKLFLTKRLSFVLFLLAAIVTKSFAAEATYKVTNPHELANKQVLIDGIPATSSFTIDFSLNENGGKKKDTGKLYGN